MEVNPDDQYQFLSVYYVIMYHLRRVTITLLSRECFLQQGYGAFYTLSSLLTLGMTHCRGRGSRFPKEREDRAGMALCLENILGNKYGECRNVKVNRKCVQRKVSVWIEEMEQL